MRTEDVLDQIDQALDDWEVGPDAMRCNAPPEEPKPRLRRFTRWPSTWSDTEAAWLWPDRQEHPTLGPRPGVVTVTIAANFVRAAAAYEEAMARVAALSALHIDDVAAMFAALADAFHPLRPDHQPPPLAIDGHAYHRRRRNWRSR